MKLSGNTILITGGTSGIGLELAKALHAKNNKVIVLGRNEAKLDAAAETGLHTIQCDLEDQGSIENAVRRIEQEYPDLNFLVNNAGVQHNYLFTEAVTPFRRVQQEIQCNLTGQIILTQMLLPLLRVKERACIINSTSGLGAFPKPDGIVYSAGKAGMRNFTTGLRYALQGTPICVMEFIPPVTATPMTAGRQEAKMQPDELVARILPQIEKERKILTVPAMRIFLWIAFLAPDLAFRILMKKEK
ncbi:MAG: SDR family NAD(P)-dependent oxidoreductase [Saprospiraceae bacterium]|nr:SDR family NAD(P)-dependent oxidoreductase [Saprospiraceae bacterium]MCB9355820.1 SDR family NAD(P)-dependent oxidoreductase [Lewinellaceae bacterium]